jgi:hypothetical protein
LKIFCDGYARRFWAIWNAPAVKPNPEEVFTLVF